MRRTAFLPLAALLLAMTACSGGAVSSSAPPVPTPSPSPSTSTEEHLPFYEEFALYNNSVDEHDFQVSEVRFNGELRYRFQNEEHGVDIYVSPRTDTDPALALAYLGPQNLDPVQFEMPAFPLGGGLVDGAAALYLEDLTGDGSPELIYGWGWGGTGVWEDHVRVFDLATTAEYPVIWDNEALSAAVSAHIGSHEIISVEVGRLTLTTCFSSEDSRPGEYTGELTADFAFDAESASFLLQTPYTITVYNPNI